MLKRHTKRTTLCVCECVCIKEKSIPFFKFVQRISCVLILLSGIFIDDAVNLPSNGENLEKSKIEHQCFRWDTLTPSCEVSEAKNEVSAHIESFEVSPGETRNRNLTGAKKHFDIKAHENHSHRV